MNIRLAVVSFLYCAGYTEDGQPFMAERYYVQAEDEKGYRWLFFKGWNGATHSVDEEGFSHFGDRREQAKALADAVCRTLVKDGVDVRDGRWDDARPAYASEAYIASGADLDDIAWERERG